MMFIEIFVFFEQETIYSQKGIYRKWNCRRNYNKYCERIIISEVKIGFLTKVSDKIEVTLRDHSPSE